MLLKAQKEYSIEGGRVLVTDRGGEVTRKKKEVVRKRNAMYCTSSPGVYLDNSNKSIKQTTLLRIFPRSSHPELLLSFRVEQYFRAISFLFFLQ